MYTYWLSISEVIHKMFNYIDSIELDIINRLYRLLKAFQ